MITICAKVLGKKASLFPDWSIPLPPEAAGAGETLTLRGLLRRIVESEVQAFRDRQERRRLLHVLTAPEIEKGVTRGKVEMGGRALVQEVDEDAAVAAALQAFQDGLYLVFLDDQEQRDLDQPVPLKEDSRVTFVRLVMLAGG
jgi:hypothetical protein